MCLKKKTNYNYHNFQWEEQEGDPKERVAALVSLSLGDRLLLMVWRHLEVVKQSSREEGLHKNRAPEIYLGIPLSSY